MLQFILIGIVLFFVLWIFFMNAVKLKDSITEDSPKWQQWGMKGIAAIFIFCDAIYNILWGSIIFMEIPKEFLMTTRMRRILAEDKNRIKNALLNGIAAKPSWRAKVAYFICAYMLEPHDPGHCKLGEKL